jgi:hypothetical protein
MAGTFGDHVSWCGKRDRVRNMVRCRDNGAREIRAAWMAARLRRRKNFRFRSNEIAAEPADAGKSVAVAALALRPRAVQLKHDNDRVACRRWDLVLAAI